jgi:hypothetical protein
MGFLLLERKYVMVVMQLSVSIVECLSLDWCNLIRKQITTKYKIRTKYNENLRPNKHNESRKTTFV